MSLYFEQPSVPSPRRVPATASSTNPIAAAVLAHDARGPLANLSLLIEGLATKPPETPHMLNSSVRHAMRLIERIDQLLCYLVEQGRAEHAQADVDHWPVALDEIIAITIDLNRPLAARSGIVWKARIPKGLYAPGDGFALMRVFDNLLTNAIKHSPPGGTIRIEAQRRTGSAVVRIIDDGPGLKRTSFRPLVEPTAPHAAQLKSHGLGLKIVKSLVALHGGKVDGADRRRRSGAVLTVTLPLWLGPRDVMQP